MIPEDFRPDEVNSFAIRKAGDGGLNLSAADTV
jgi:hypothetical protein